MITVKSVPKQFNLLILHIKLSNNSCLYVAGCYRPPSAPVGALTALSCLLAPHVRSEFVLLGDLNWDMLKPPEKVSLQLESLNLLQIISTPTRHDTKQPEKTTLIDVILTNTPHIYRTGVFCNDLSDHCFTACIRANCSVKKTLLVCYKRCLKNFTEQVILHSACRQDAWNLFYNDFSTIINKHAPEGQ